MNLLLGDCLDSLKTLEANSIDSVVTDPPYGLKFMGKKWDYAVPSVEIWREVLRVLKPGGHVLSFCGTRTYHRMVVNMEDAGFEIRDQIQWIYGSGFPKSTDVSKRIDKEAGAEREVTGLAKGHVDAGGAFDDDSYEWKPTYERKDTPSTEAAKQWQGWGTGLKPANEPICLARKPLVGTVAQNVLKYGVGGLNIDASRIETDDSLNGGAYSGDDRASKNGDKFKITGDVGLFVQPQGRWPANVIFDEEAAAVLDGQSRFSKSSDAVRNNNPSKNVAMAGDNFGHISKGHSDSGGASRFFYVAKASKKERNAGLEGMPEKHKGENLGQLGGLTGSGNPRNYMAQNHHPTVKPIKLMQYLIRLITPRGGFVLDPFMGSGSTGVAAKSLGFEFVGCELSAEYLEIAKKRIEAVA